MGPNYWKKRSTGLKKCAEFSLGNSCPEPVFEDCCKIIACSYCLELTMYGEDTQYSVAEFSDTGYVGTIGGLSFELFVRRNEYTNVCESVVLLDGIEVYVKSCDDGMSCRDLSDQADVTIDYEVGTLQWTKIEFRNLEHILDPVTKCPTWFCGNCECTCEELCYTMSNLELETSSGTMPQLSYNECDGPTWGVTFTLGSEEYTIYAELVRDEETGSCILQVRLNGEDVDPVPIEDCKAISASWNLYGGGSFGISCKTCGCNPRTGCCPNLPSTLYATIDLTATTTPMPGICPTIRLYGTIQMDLSVDGETAIWQSVSTPIDGDSCGVLADPRPEFYAIASCGPTGISLSIGTNESATAGVIWQAFYEGCTGGILTACDPNVTQAFGGRSDCDNWGALSV